MFVLLAGIAVILVPGLQAVPFDIGTRIINGSDVDIKDYPYMVSFKFNGEHVCGGTILDEYNILTAAHCTTRDVSNFSVLVGYTDMSNKIDTIPVEEIVLHGSYRGFWPLHNDVAIVQLSRPLEFSESVQPVQLPIAFDPIPEQTIATLTGWGQDTTDGPLRDILQKVEIITYSDSECEEIYAEGSGTNRIYQLCAGVPEGGKGQCNGDSGGPLLIDGVQVGIVSWSAKPCTKEGYPGVFTKVSTYVDWINCNLKTA